MDIHGFQNIFPIILLIIWVVVKAMAGKKPKAPPREARPQPSWAPRPNSPEEAERPKPRGQLYDSMKEVMQEYFGEAPAPARKEAVDEEEYEDAASFEPEPETPASRAPARQWEMERTSEEAAADEAYSTPKPVSAPPRTVVPLETATAPVTPLPVPATTEFFDRPSEISSEEEGTSYGDIDPRKAIVWSEIIGPPLALRD